MSAPTAPGVRRRLQRLTTPAGRFHVIALDHRDSLQRELERIGASATVDDIRAFKRRVLAAATPYCSGVMLEPEWTWPRFADGTVARGVGVICALEAQGYDADPSLGNRWLDGWDPTQLAASGADAAKLLVLYRPDDSELARRQEQLVRRSVEACADLGLPLFVEPVPFDVADPRERLAAVVGAADRLGSFGPMVLKLPFPGAGACAELHAACAGTPWALLSWGVGFDEFADQFAEAVDAGCDGFMVGRAVWREALESEGDRTDALVAERLARLVAISESG